MKKKAAILSIFLLVVGSCGQAKGKIKINNSQNRLELSKSWHYKYTNLSDQFDIEMSIEFYTDTVIYQNSWQGQDSLMVKLLITEKTTSKLLDTIVVNPIAGFPFLNDEYRFAISFSTEFNADKEIVDNYFGSIIVADVNFDGKDDIAVAFDGGNSGGYYIFFIQNENVKFVVDDFLTERVSFFPYKIDYQQKQITTGARSGVAGAGFHTYQFDSITEKWEHIRYEYIGQEGHFVYKIDPVTNERIEINRKLNEEK
jgi:hypothetical protein